MNFITDVYALLVQRLRGLGYAPRALTGVPYADAHGAYIDLANAKARRIAAQARRVRLSTELVAREPCLSSDTRDGLLSLAYDLAFGRDVTSKLSRGVKKRGGKDELLWDWDIHHLHLGARLEKDGFVERTGDLLFVLVRPATAYLIDVRPHGAWADDELVEIIHRNWPHEISRFKFALTRSSGTITPGQRQHARMRGMNAPIQTKDGTLYGMMGGGFTSSRESARMVIDGDMVLGQALQIEEFLRRNHEWLKTIVAERIGSVPDRAHLQLVELTYGYADVLVKNGINDFGIRIPISPEPATAGST